MIEQTQLMALKNLGASATRVQALYVPDQFVTIEATAAGDTNVFVAGNNFLLLGFTITVAGTLAAAGEQVIKLIDTAAGGDPAEPVVIWEGSTFLTATAVGNAFFGQDYGGGYGYLSGITNTTMVVSLSEAMVTGRVCVNAWGTFDVFPSP
jgi:hypothetical protein